MTVNELQELDKDRERIQNEKDKAIRNIVCNDFKYLLTSLQNLMIKKQIMIAMNPETNEMILVHHKYGETLAINVKELNLTVKNNPQN